ncbi:DUF5694 domain-containing protein [Luteimonas sp. BDR2-5]|uniref:DUF5694 domain-containing protein n=1 Tax=Proluteimonas luteida TaxID=2878685 RepID=UPI001E58520A|nr:DUF5694 domain-containing protein [Luteimonas sp. BDR2-5]MCD9027893.1 DUF5694 domain-containing protein [Luteimonas sp. BDR2-5]
MNRPLLLLSLLLCATMSGTGAHAADGAGGGAARLPSHAVDEALAPHVTPRLQNQILVLGSWHLGEFHDWLEPRHMQSTLAVLARYAPTRIAIEKIPPDEIALLAELAEVDPAAKELIDLFARHVLVQGKAMQASLDIGRAAAGRHAEALLERAEHGLAPEERLELVAHLLAAYEYDTATLQWSYLAPGDRERSDTLPASVREAMDKYLRSADEAVTVAMPLARSLGLQRLYPVDSHYEAVRTLSFPEDVSEAVFDHPSKRQWTASDAWQRLQAARERVKGDGDMLAMYRYLNAYPAGVDDAGQWIHWLTMDHPSGLDRLRYAMWELRDQRMAANVMDAAASAQPERLLFIVGFSHKAYVERSLATRLSVRLVQLEDFLPADRTGSSP